MKNIFKATLYGITKSKVMVYSLICSFIFPAVLAFIPITSTEKLEAINGTWDNFSFMCALIYLVFICAINCNDYKNKTINFEIMNGYSSIEIFGGRFLAFVLFAEIMFNMGLLVMHIMFSLNEEYITITSSSGLGIMRLLIIEIVYFAYFSYFTFCSFLARNVVLAIIFSWLGFAISGITGILDDLFAMDRSFSFYMGPYTLKFLFMEAYTSEQLIITAIIPIFLTILFIFLGITTVRKQEY